MKSNEYNNNNADPSNVDIPSFSRVSHIDFDDDSSIVEYESVTVDYLLGLYDLVPGEYEDISEVDR